MAMKIEHANAFDYRYPESRNHTAERMKVTSAKTAILKSYYPKAGFTMSILTWHSKSPRLLRFWRDTY